MNDCTDVWVLEWLALGVLESAELCRECTVHRISQMLLNCSNTISDSKSSDFFPAPLRMNSSLCSIDSEPS